MNGTPLRILAGIAAGTEYGIMQPAAGTGSFIMAVGEDEIQ